MEHPSLPESAQPAARTAEEHALQVMERTVRAVLGRPIGPDENFFDAGLTSLTLVQLHQVSTRELPDPFPVTVMFACPNLRALRRHLTEEAPAPAAPGGLLRPTDATQLRRTAVARRELRRRIRTESESA